MIDYDDSTHIYSHRGRRYLSATQLIDQFTNGFCSKEEAVKFAYKHGFTADYWLEKWEDTRNAALVRGNRIHNLRERITLNRGMDVAFGKPRIVQNTNFYADLPSLRDIPDGIYPELILWDHRYGIAGRADRVIIETVEPGPRVDKGGREVWYPAPYRVAHIQDFKTNRFIRMKSWMDAHGNHIMMKAPLEDLMDSVWNHYQMQLSFYQHMLEYHGFAPGRREIIHFPHRLAEAPPDAPEPAPVVHACEYLKDHVSSALNYLKHRRVI